jgi:hypothetical protein
MSKLKQLQLEIAHLIDNTADQEKLVHIFFDVKTGGASAMLRNKTAQTIVDLKRLYGENLHTAINIMLDADRRMNENNLTNCKEVPQETNNTEECGK